MLSAKENEYISSLMKKCESGDVFAMEEVATFYYEDHPELMNDVTSRLVIEYYEKAAAVCHQKASLNLGAIYCDGLYAKQDYSRAIELLKSALSGDSARIAAIAASRLGDCYFLGNGVNTDYSRAFDYYLEGILLCNHPVCLYKLGDMYRFGRFVNQNSEMAYCIYCKAKSQSQRFNNDGYREILIRLAEAKIDGLGTDKNVPEALKYLEMAKIAPNKSSRPENVQQRIDSLTKKANEA